MNKPFKTQLAILSSAILLAACNGSSSDSSSAEVTDRTVQGTVDGFGSVIVNGVHYQATGAEFSIDDRAGVETDLQVGQVVTIVGSDDGAEGVALSITYDVGVEGPVSSVDTATSTFVVLGQTVVFDAMTVFKGMTDADLLVGAMVEVSGYTDGNGQIRATFIKADNSGEAETRGYIAALDETAKTFTIGTQLVNYANVSEFKLDGAALANNLMVEVEGTIDAGGVLVAAKIEAEYEHSFQHHEGEAKLNGYITAITDGSITVGSTEVTLAASTRYEHGTAADLSLNTFVKVEGQVDASGVMVAEEVKFESQVKLEVEGPVTAVSDTTVSVMGVTATVDTSTRIRDERDDITYFNLSDVSAGDYVELRLSQEADGSLRALRLERDDNENEVKVTAPVDALDLAAGTVTMLGITVDMSAITLVDLTTLVAGSYLEVKGTFDGSIITAAEAGEDDRYENHEGEDHDGEGHDDEDDDEHDELEGDDD